MNAFTNKCIFLVSLFFLESEFYFISQSLAYHGADILSLVYHGA
jgi:hypothetical protein